MVFWRKSEDKKSDIDAIKERVAPPPPPPPTYNYPQPLSGPLPEPPRMQMPTQLPARAPVTRMPQDFAPLFVKIDRYKDILEKLEETKSTLQALTSTIVLINQVDQIRDDAVKRLTEVVGRLTDVLISLDGQFIRPEGADMGLNINKESGRVEEYLTDLQTEMRHLRGELDRMSR